MDEENEKRNFFDITQYSEKTRKIFFWAFVGIMVAAIGIAIFFVSPKNDADIVAESTPSPTATQAPVDNENGSTPREEAVTPEEDISLQLPNEVLPADEKEELARAQQEIIEKSLQREKEQTDEVVEDTHDDIPDATQIQSIASKGMLEYCTDIPNETKEQKQQRMQPYFHHENSQYQTPQSIFSITKCSLGGVTEPYFDENNNIIVDVGIAWGAQFEEDGTAQTGYTQYRVLLDANGIISFND